MTDSRVEGNKAEPSANASKPLAKEIQMITPPAENINIARRMRETASWRGITSEILRIEGLRPSI